MRKLVLLSGKLMSGKSTQARKLAAIPEWGYRQEFLAGALKDDLASLPLPLLSASNKHIWRPLLQVYGTEVAKKFYGDDYWVKRLIAGIADSPYETNGLVIDDVRFPEEVYGLRDWAEECGAKFCAVRLNVSPPEQKRRHLAATGEAVNPDTLAHRSEIALDGYYDWDVILNADQDIWTVHSLLLQNLALRGMGEVPVAACTN